MEENTYSLVYAPEKSETNFSHHMYEVENPNDAEKLIYDNTVSEGMIPKIRTCINALNDGVKGVVIIDGRKAHSILFELFSDKGSGTLIRK